MQKKWNTMHNKTVNIQLCSLVQYSWHPEVLWPRTTGSTVLFHLTLELMVKEKMAVEWVISMAGVRKNTWA